MSTATVTTPVDVAAEKAAALARAQAKREEDWTTARARMLLGRMREAEAPATLREAAEAEWPALTAEARARVVERAIELRDGGDGARHIDPATVTVAPPEKRERRTGRWSAEIMEKKRALRAAIGALVEENHGITARQAYDRLAGDGLDVGTFVAFRTQMGKVRARLEIPGPATGGPRKNGKAPGLKRGPGKTRTSPAGSHPGVAIGNTLATLAAAALANTHQVPEAVAPPAVGAPRPPVTQALAQVEPGKDTPPVHKYAAPDTQRITEPLPAIEPARPYLEVRQDRDGSWDIRARGPLKLIVRMIDELNRSVTYGEVKSP